MHKRKFNILAFLIIILFPCRLKAQSEQDVLLSILNKLADYTSRFPREEIFIHTDRDEYVAGEDLWFNIYLTDRKSLLLSGNSSIAYTELLNVDNNPVARKMILLAAGTGPGHLILPDTLSTGIYTFRAYTNQMKNQLPYNCFSKEITVYNTLKKESTWAIKNVNRPLRTLYDVAPDSAAMISIYSAGNDSLEIKPGLKVYGNKDGVEQGPYYLVIQSRGNPDFSGAFRSAETRICVAKNILSPGISQAVVFDGKGFPVASRYFYTPATNADTLKILVNEVCGTREKINIGFETGSNKTNKLNASISVAPFTGHVSPGIDDFLVFGSEFNSRSGYFTEDILRDMSEEERDSVLLRLESNWIKWDEILSGQSRTPEYLAEKQFHFVYGLIPGGKGDTVLMCSPSSRPSFRYTRTDGSGNFVFRIRTDEKPGDLIFIQQNRSAEARPVLQSSFSDKNYSSPGRDSIRIIPSYFARMAVDYQVRRLFKITNTGNESSFQKPGETAGIYGRPDMEIKLSDYVELPTMYEIFLELVPGVSLRPVKKGYEIQMTDRINDKRIELDPTLMIDGVPVKDASLIAELDPALVERIEITRQKYLIGDYLFNGIIDVITKAADFSCIPLPEYMTRVKYPVTDTVPSFISPDYTTTNSRNSRLPDYRNTLYWNPSLARSAGFWSCDNKMKYVISIQGVAENGKPFSIRKIIEVK